EVEVYMIDEPQRGSRFFGRSMMMTIYEITNKETHSGAGDCIRYRMTSTSEAGDTHCGCSTVSRERHPFRFRKFARSDARQRPRFNRMSGWECVATGKEFDGIAFVFRPPPLSGEFQYVRRNVRIDQGLDSNSRRIACTRILACLAVKIEARPNWVDGI